MSLVIICGATATGKSDLAISVAKEINAEIVNADSMQLYKGMDIGTAKLSLLEREGIKHHLLDELEISEEAKMHLIYVPYAPTVHERILLKNRKVLADQMEYLKASIPKNSRVWRMAS